MMRKVLGILFFYILLAVLLLPLAVTLLLGGNIASGRFWGWCDICRFFLLKNKKFL